MLRDQHRRERYRERERRESGVGLLNYRPWRYAAILSFLNPFIDARAAGTNGWALDPRTPQQDMVGCSMTMEMRSDDDDSYGGTDCHIQILFPRSQFKLFSFFFIAFWEIEYSIFV